MTCNCVVVHVFTKYVPFNITTGKSTSSGDTAKSWAGAWKENWPGIYIYIHLYYH